MRLGRLWDEGEDGWTLWALMSYCVCVECLDCGVQSSVDVRGMYVGEVFPVNNGLYLLYSVLCVLCALCALCALCVLCVACM